MRLANDFHIRSKNDVHGITFLSTLRLQVEESGTRQKWKKVIKTFRLSPICETIKTRLILQDFK